MDYQSLLSGPRNAFNSMLDAGAKTAARGMVPPGEDWASRRNRTRTRDMMMQAAANQFGFLPDVPGPAPGWRDQKLDQLLAGNAPGVHHGAFGGRSVQIPGGQYRVHPMAVNSAPMAPMQQPAGDPGLWFNQTPQPFNARGYVDANSQRINAGQMRAVANLRPDGGVQLRGGGQFMDPVSAARAYAQMGGKGLTFDNAGQPVLNGMPANAESMFRANMALRTANSNARMDDIRSNARKRQAWGQAQEGNLAPLMKAVGDGLIKLPQGNDQEKFGRGQRFAAEAALGMLEGLPAHQRAALIGPLAKALESGDVDAFGTAAANMGKMTTRNEEVAKGARSSVTTPQVGDVDMAMQYKTGEEAFQSLMSQGFSRNRAVAATKRAFKDWSPRWAGVFDFTDPDTGEVKSLAQHPSLAWMFPGHMAGNPITGLGNARGAPAQPQAQAFQGGTAPAGPGWMDQLGQLGHRFLGTQWGGQPPVPQAPQPDGFENAGPAPLGQQPGMMQNMFQNFWGGGQQKPFKNWRDWAASRGF